jgi:hypothetical protein
MLLSQTIKDEDLRRRSCRTWKSSLPDDDILPPLDASIVDPHVDADGDWKAGIKAVAALRLEDPVEDESPGDWIAEIKALRILRLKDLVEDESPGDWKADINVLRALRAIRLKVPVEDGFLGEWKADNEARRALRDLRLKDRVEYGPPGDLSWTVEINALRALRLEDPVEHKSPEQSSRLPLENLHLPRLPTKIDGPNGKSVHIVYTHFIGTDDTDILPEVPPDYYTVVSKGSGSFIHPYIKRARVLVGWHSYG